MISLRSYQEQGIGEIRMLFKDGVALSGIPVTIVEPSVWKRFHKLPGKEKEASRQRALEIFPASHALLARKLDHGRGEAALIALFGARQ
jgi:hypothetical protein